MFLVGILIQTHKKYKIRTENLKIVITVIGVHLWILLSKWATKSDKKISFTKLNRFKILHLLLLRWFNGIDMISIYNSLEFNLHWRSICCNPFLKHNPIQLMTSNKKKYIMY